MMNESANQNSIENKKEAVKTFIEQTKLLVTLSSAFIIPPAVMYVTIKGFSLKLLVITECLFVLSTILGYVVLGTITGSQNNGEYNVYRPATMRFSLLEFLLYLGGLIVFIFFVSNHSDSIKDDVQKAKCTTFQIQSPEVIISVGDTIFKDKGQVIDSSLKIIKINKNGDR